MCTSQCKDFLWKMQGRAFLEGLLIIPLGGCALVLGKDRMEKHNPTNFDHEKKCVTIGRKGNKLVLPGLAEEGRLIMMSSGTMRKMLKKGQTLISHLFMMSLVTTREEVEIDVESSTLKCLLNQTPYHLLELLTTPYHSSLGLCHLIIGHINTTIIRRMNWRGR